jgi:hypothetical protein
LSIYVFKKKEKKARNNLVLSGLVLVLLAAEDSAPLYSGSEKHLVCFVWE